MQAKLLSASSIRRRREERDGRCPLLTAEWKKSSAPPPLRVDIKRDEEIGRRKAAWHGRGPASRGIIPWGLESIWVSCLIRNKRKAHQCGRQTYEVFL